VGPVTHSLSLTHTHTHTHTVRILLCTFNLTNQTSSSTFMSWQAVGSCRSHKTNQTELSPKTVAVKMVFDIHNLCPLFVSRDLNGCSLSNRFDFLRPCLTAPAAGVSEAFDGGSVSCGVGVRALPGGVCGQQAAGRREGCGSRQKPPSVHVGASPPLCPLFTLSFIFIFIFMSDLN